MLSFISRNIHNNIVVIFRVWCSFWKGKKAPSILVKYVSKMFSILSSLTSFHFNALEQFPGPCLCSLSPSNSLMHSLPMPNETGRWDDTIIAAYFQLLWLLWRYTLPSNFPTLGSEQCSSKWYLFYSYLEYLLWIFNFYNTKESRTGQTMVKNLDLVCSCYFLKPKKLKDLSAP